MINGIKEYAEAPNRKIGIGRCLFTCGIVLFQSILLNEEFKKPWESCTIPVHFTTTFSNQYFLSHRARTFWKN